MKDNAIDFKSQNFFVGIDVHKKNWSITIRCLGLKLENFKMDPVPEQLAVHLNKKYPEGSFNSVYEAAFSGFWIHHRLIKLGINNIVVNPADVPTTNKEKSNKNDIVDSRKLAKELENGTLNAIHIQSIEEQPRMALS